VHHKKTASPEIGFEIQKRAVLTMRRSMAEWVSRDNLDEKSGNQGENGWIAGPYDDCR
jgi:hypothetical protein